MSALTTYRFPSALEHQRGRRPLRPRCARAYPDRKFALYKSLGFDGVQFHDDDVVPDSTN